MKGDTFQKTIRGSIHMLRKPQMLSFDVSTLDQAAQAGALKVEVIDKESGITYRTTIEHIRAAGFAVNRGYGVQIGLVLTGWTKTSRGQQFSEQPVFNLQGVMK